MSKERKPSAVKPFLIGAITATMVFAVWLNIAQYKGLLTSPQVVKLEQTDEQKLQALYGGM